MRKVITILFISFYCITFSQPVSLFTDKPFYITGESIWFKLHFHSTQISKNASIKTIISNEAGEIKDYFFLKKDQRPFVSGHFAIPYDYTSGMYAIHFLSKDTVTGQVIKIISYEVPIYNDIETINPTLSEYLPTSQNKNQTDYQIKISLIEKIHPREKQTLNLKITDTSGTPVTSTIAISVIDSRLIPGQPLSYASNNVNSLKSIGSPFFYSFNLPDKKEENAQSIIGLFSPLDWKVQYNSPRSTRMTQEMACFTGAKPIQLIPLSDRNTTLHEESKINYTFSSKLIYTPAIMQYMEWSTLRKKIYQLYSSVETPLTFAQEKINIKDNRLEPDRVFATTKYETMENLSVFFREVTTPLSFKLNKKTKKYDAYLYDPSTFIEYQEAPLFIVDNKIVNNTDGIARMPMSLIESIDMYYDFKKIYFHFKLLGRNGVIHIHTKSKSANPDLNAKNIFELKGYQSKAMFPSIGSEKLTSNQPIFKSTVYWNPEVTTDSKGEATIEFIQPDDISDYQVTIVAQSPEGNVSIKKFSYSALPKSK